MFEIFPIFLVRALDARCKELEKAVVDALDAVDTAEACDGICQDSRDQLYRILGGLVDRSAPSQGTPNKEATVEP